MDSIGYNAPQRRRKRRKKRKSRKSRRGKRKSAAVENKNQNTDAQNDANLVI